MQTLFDQPPYQAHSETSRDAAVSMRGKTARIRDLVLDAIKERPSTDEELVARLQISQNTVRPRRVELVQRGLVVEGGRRKTQSGRTAIVWTANDLLEGGVK
jgi:predicted ArsR family transcriptional regulator